MDTSTRSNKTNRNGQNQQQQLGNSYPPLTAHSEHLRQLTDPPPKSMVLTASLQLLTGPLVPPHNVYLMTPHYLQNWLNWTYHQPVGPAEKDRLMQVLRLAAIRHSLVPPTKNAQYTDPGPIDAKELSMPGHPLLLRPDASVLVQPATPNHTQSTPALMNEDETTPAALRRARSLPSNNQNQGYIDSVLSAQNGNTSVNGEEGTSEFRGCAVPEIFYEVS